MTKVEERRVAHVQCDYERPSSYYFCPKCRVIVPQMYEAWTAERKRLHCWCGGHVDHWKRIELVGLPSGTDFSAFEKGETTC